MDHSKWIGKTLGEFIEHVSSTHSYAIGFYSVNHSISLDEVIGLCVYDKKFLDKYYVQTIKNITGHGYDFNISV